MGSLGWVSWLNLGGFVPGLALMYFTAFLVKFREYQSCSRLAST